MDDERDDRPRARVMVLLAGAAAGAGLAMLGPVRRAWAYIAVSAGSGASALVRSLTSGVDGSWSQAAALAAVLVGCLTPLVVVAFAVPSGRRVLRAAGGAGAGAVLAVGGRPGLAAVVMGATAVSWLPWQVASAVSGTLAASSFGLLFEAARVAHLGDGIGVGGAGTLVRLVVLTTTAAACTGAVVLAWRAGRRTND